MVSLWKMCLGTGAAVVASTVVIASALRMMRGRGALAYATSLKLKEPPAHVVAACAPGRGAPPKAVVDVDAFIANIRALAAPLRASGKAVRIATKSVRSVALIELARQVCEDECGVPVQGIMTFTAAESLVWARRRTFSDILLAYPVGHARGAYDVILCNVENPTKVRCSVVVDGMAQVELLLQAAEEWVEGQEALVNTFDSSVASVTIPLVLDIDMSWRPFGLTHIGVRRSPLRTAKDVTSFMSALSKRVSALAARKSRIGINVVVVGVMGYEAQIAGLPEHTHRHAAGLGPLAPIASSLYADIKAAIKLYSAREAFARRQQLVASVLAPTSGTLVAPPGRFFVNGGGSGSVVATCRDSSVTEVTIGSGMLCGHIFDGYDDNVALSPSLYFSLPICRVSDAGKFVTCAGGGWVASGPPALDRLPIPVYPAQAVEHISMEGAGEVQTPLAVVSKEGARLAVGDVVIFRPAKSGELGEVFSSYQLVTATGAGAFPSAVKTYRGDAIEAWA